MTLDPALAVCRELWFACYGGSFNLKSRQNDKEASSASMNTSIKSLKNGIIIEISILILQALFRFLYSRQFTEFSVYLSPFCAFPLSFLTPFDANAKICF
jgi:hypothetical protein